MSIYEIAGLYVEMNPRFDKLIKQSEKYLSHSHDGSVDMIVEVQNEFLENKKRESPHLTYEDCEYMWLGAKFYKNLINFNGFVLHASAIEYHGEAYLFTAPSGTGKSTHTQLWQQYFGEDKVTIINDDKPAVIYRDGQFFACGTPFSGKYDISCNICIPINGICILERSTNNNIVKLNASKALLSILNQTFRPNDEWLMGKLLATLDQLFEHIPIYKMGCNVSHDAALMAFMTMRGEK